MNYVKSKEVDMVYLGDNPYISPNKGLIRVFLHYTLL